ncbi:hypothetical protein CBR_g40725 [Chara braunii]|uniref:DDE Tnp4 domain-containing protein n=1 Tax=Chara braunii TaxID=69332 RepID=A0A388LUJ4_CHABU|nr:hypothetical protein CBR_g40725 [Chara braunii]|eukprot:GBG85913.1 hypothetical protein CBR_g40725 [Chara braunii]
MEGCDGDGRAVLSRTEKTTIAAVAVAIVRRFQVERAAGCMKATLSRRRQRLLLQRVLDASDCITTSEAMVQLCAAIGCGVLPRATPRWWMRRRAGGTWEDLRVCDDVTYDFFRGKLRISRRVVVDLDLPVLDVFVGYPGNCHDIRVIQLSSLSGLAVDGMLFRGPPVMLLGGVSTNGYILGDNGYPPSEWVVVPYGGINQHPDEEKFGTKQKVASGAVERAFGRLKGMWRLFLRTHKTNLDTLPQQFTAVSILHNILLDTGIEFEENLLWEVDENGVRRRLDLGIHHPPQLVTMLTSTHAAHALHNKSQ